MHQGGYACIQHGFSAGRFPLLLKGFLAIYIVLWHEDPKICVLSGDNSLKQGVGFAVNGSRR